MMGYEFRKIFLGKLELDQNNPRYHSTNDQEEAFKTMIERDGAQLRQMANHVRKFGQNPSVMPIVYETPDGRFIVKDGNRRTAAIKALMKPSLIPREFEGMRNKFKKMSEGLDRSMFKSILCTVFDNEEEADRWVKLNHHGVQGGIGQKGWGPVQKMRDDVNHGSNSYTLELFEFWQGNSGEPLNEDTFNISAFQRLVPNTEFNKYVNLDRKEGKIVRSYSIDETIRLMKPMIDDILSGAMDTRKLGTSEHVNAYVREISETHVPTEIPLSVPVPLEDYEADDPSNGNGGYFDGIPTPDGSDADPTSDPFPGSKPARPPSGGGPPASKFFETLKWKNKLDPENPLHIGLLCNVEELYNMSRGRKKKYKALPIATGHLVRSAYEQAIKLLMMNHNQWEQDRTTKMKELEKDVINWTDCGKIPASHEMKDALKHIKNLDHREFLNNNVHNPNYIRATPEILESIAMSGMLTFIQEVINSLPDVSNGE